MIERRNIIKMLSDRVNAYHSAILTCFNFDPIFFETVYLPMLRRLGITNIIVLSEATMYDKMLADDSYGCCKVTLSGYTLVRQENSHGGVFHSKMILLFGMEESAVIVGSGNITFSGMSNNTEIWNAFHVKGAQSPNFPILKKGWGYAKELLENASPLIRRQLNWIAEQCEWLNTPSSGDTILMANGETATLLYNCKDETIYSALLKHVDAADVDCITVIAPFYDPKGDAVKVLKDVFHPKKVRCMLDIERQSAPYDLMKEQTDVEFFRYESRSPLHAKLIEIQAADETWLLSGSANIGGKALGLDRSAYNDEACILIHSKKNRSFIADLGLEICFKPMADDEVKAIQRPKADNAQRSKIELSILSCELSDSRLHLTLNKSGVDCNVVIFNQSLEIIIEAPLVATEKMLDFPAPQEAYLVVLQRNGLDISNRCLVFSELQVERCNPDPKRRKLSSLLNDDGLMGNIGHILGYIEFDEEDIKKRLSHSGIGASKKEKKDDLGNTVSKQYFDELKDNSALSISMHPSVRILSFLKDILFRQPNAGNDEEELLKLQEENESESSISSRSTIGERLSRETDLCIKVRNDIYSFLQSMKSFLLLKTQDAAIQKEGNQGLPLDANGCLPKLVAKPGLNQSSAFAVAATIVSYLMQNYGNKVPQKTELREAFYECLCLFLGVYGQRFSIEDDTNRQRKCYEMLKDATAMMLVSLCHFDFAASDYQLILTVLNALDAWKGDKEAIKEIVDSFREKIAEIDNVVYESTYRLINSVIDRSVNDEIPLNDLADGDELFMYKSGYGFFFVDEVTWNGRQWHFSYHHPRYCNDNILISGISKYKGYRYSDFK